MSGTDITSSPVDPLGGALPPPPRFLAFPLHPSFWWGVFWCIGLLVFTQIPGGIVSVVILFTGAYFFPSVTSVEQMQDSSALMQTFIGQISIAAGVLVSHGLIIFFSLVLLRILAGRDWPRQVALRLPAVTHVCLVIVVAPAFLHLAGGVYTLFSSVLYVPGTGDDIPGVAAFWVVLAALLVLLRVGVSLLHVRQHEDTPHPLSPEAGARGGNTMPLAGQIGLALLFVAAVRFPAIWAYSSLRKFFQAGFLGTFQLAGMEQMEQLFSKWPVWIAVYTIGVMPALSEELWCRAFLGRGLVGKHGLFWGVLGTSFLFGAIHADPRQGAMAMTVGLMIHYVYLTTRSLFLPMLLHCLNNSTAMVLPRIPSLAWLDQPEGKGFGASYAGAACLLAAVVWTLYETRARLVADAGQPSWRPPYAGVACPPPGSGTRVWTPTPSLVSLGLVLLGLAAFAGGLTLAQAR